MAGRTSVLVLMSLCMMPLETFIYVFFFIDRAWRSQVFQGFLSLPFCTGLDHRGWVVHFSLQQWKLCRVLCWEIGLCSLSHEASGWRSTELLAAFIRCTWQLWRSVRTRHGQQTSFSNVYSSTHKAFYWCLGWVRYSYPVLIHYCANANIWLIFQITREGSCGRSGHFL